MIKKSIIYMIAVAIMTLAVTSCNQDVVTEEEVLSSSAQVKSFSLKADKKVLENLDRIYFTIDLNNSRIYNADSMPYGTDIRKLLPSLSVASSSSIEFIISGAKLHSDTTYNYLSNPNDTIDFSGKTILRVVSADEKTTRDYQVFINVHQMKPDSLYWNETAKSELPTTIASPTAQKAIEYDGKVICLAQGDGKYTWASTENPGLNNWEIKDVTFPFTPDVESLAASTDAIYMLDTDGNLYSSTDATTWNPCGQKWHSILGQYMASVVGVESRSDGYYHAQYPASSNFSSTKIEADFPIDGTSQLVEYSNEWSQASQAIMTGGLKADGTPTSATWGFDGRNWGKISESKLPALSGMTLFPYFGYRTNTTKWTVTKATIWVAMGGRDAQGKAQREVYYSYDSGVNWKTSDYLMQLPEYIPDFYDAQALIFTEVIASRGFSAWQEMPSKALPGCWDINKAFSRASRPITEWECPYIYLFGGKDSNGNTYDTVWRGVINRLTFKPLQ